MSFLTIKDLKGKDKLIKEYLENRNQIKSDFNNQKIFDNEIIEEKTKLFEPITNSLTKNNQMVMYAQRKYNDAILDKQSQIQNEVKSLKAPKLIPYSPMVQKQLPQLPDPLKPTLINQSGRSSTSNQSNPIKVSQIISTYLSDSTDRSNAGYSLRYNNEHKKFAIGNSFVSFVDNEINIKGKSYLATNGLLELLTKSNPNTSKIIEPDYDNYKRILQDTNGIYTNFDPNNRTIVHNKSGKFQLLREKIFPELFKKSGLGVNNVELLPSDPNLLVNQLKLSIGSYKAGNNGEYNRINDILDTLVKLEVITKCQYKSIFQNVF